MLKQSKAITSSVFSLSQKVCQPGPDVSVASVTAPGLCVWDLTLWKQSWFRQNTDKYLKKVFFEYKSPVHLDTSVQAMFKFVKFPVVN